jgi:hypothetical protein
LIVATESLLAVPIRPLRPFAGMPVFGAVDWLPLTHYIRIVRGFMLKDVEWGDLQRDSGSQL